MHQQEQETNKGDVKANTQAGNKAGGKFPEKTGETSQAEGDRETIEADLKEKDSKQA